MHEFLKKAGKMIPRDDAGWTLLDGLLARLCQHTISTAAKLMNLARLQKLEFGEDGEQRRTDPQLEFRPGKGESETMVMTNLSIATKQPLMTALNNLNLLPGLKGNWKTDCEFLPGTERLTRQGAMLGTGSASVTVRRTPAGLDKLKSLYVGGTQLNIVGQLHPPTIRLDRGNRGEVNPRLALVPPSDQSRPHYIFTFALVGLYCPESDILKSMVYLAQRTHSITSAAELYTDEAGKCAANVMLKEQGGRGGQLFMGIASKRKPMHEAQQDVLQMHDGKVLDFCIFASYPKEHDVPHDLRCFNHALTLQLRLSRTGRSTEREMKSTAAVAMRLNHEQSRNAMQSVVREGQGGTAAAVEAVLEKRFKDLLHYCLGSQLTTDQLEALQACVEVEVTTQRSYITERSLIILMFGDQSTFPKEQVRYWALQIAVMVAIRSGKPELCWLHFCPVTNYQVENPDPGAASRSKACTLVWVSYEGLTKRHRLFYEMLDPRQNSGPTAGTLSDADALQDPVTSNILASILGGQHNGALTNGTILALAECRKTHRMNGDKSVSEVQRATIQLKYKPQNMRHYGAANHCSIHGSNSATDLAKPDTELANMQALLLDSLGQYLDLSVDIGKELATILAAAIQETATDQDTIMRVQTALQHQLYLWAATATIAPMSHQEMLCCVHPDRIDRATITKPVNSNLMHRTLIGALSFFVKIQRYTDVAAVSQLMWNILEDILGHAEAARGTQYLAVAVMQLRVAKAGGADETRDTRMIGLCTQLQTPPRCITCGRYYDDTACDYCTTPHPCFQAGTRVPTVHHGVQNLEDLRQGDFVFSSSPLQPEITREVACVFEFECLGAVADMTKIKETWLTPQHVVWTATGWRPAGSTRGATTLPQHPCQKVFNVALKGVGNMVIQGGIVATTLGFSLEPLSSDEPQYLQEHMQQLESLPDFEKGRLTGQPTAMRQHPNGTLVLCPSLLRVAQAPIAPNPPAPPPSRPATTGLMDLPEALLVHILTLSSRPVDWQLEGNFERSIYFLRSRARTCTGLRQTTVRILDLSGEMMVAHNNHVDQVKESLQDILNHVTHPLGGRVTHAALLARDSLASDRVIQSLGATVIRTVPSSILPTGSDDLSSWIGIGVTALIRHTLRRMPWEGMANCPRVSSERFHWQNDDVHLPTLAHQLLASILHIFTHRIWVFPELPPIELALKGMERLVTTLTQVATLVTPGPGPQTTFYFASEMRIQAQLTAAELFLGLLKYADPDARRTLKNEDANEWCTTIKLWLQTGVQRGGRLTMGDIFERILQPRLLLTAKLLLKSLEIITEVVNEFDDWAEILASTADVISNISKAVQTDRATFGNHHLHNELLLAGMTALVSLSSLLTRTQAWHTGDELNHPVRIQTWAGDELGAGLIHALRYARNCPKVVALVCRALQAIETIRVPTQQEAGFARLVLHEMCTTANSLYPGRKFSAEDRRSICHAVHRLSRKIQWVRPILLSTGMLSSVLQMMTQDLKRAHTLLPGAEFIRQLSTDARFHRELVEARGVSFILHALGSGDNGALPGVAKSMNSREAQIAECALTALANLTEQSGCSLPDSSTHMLSPLRGKNIWNVLLQVQKVMIWARTSTESYGVDKDKTQLAGFRSILNLSRFQDDTKRKGRKSGPDQAGYAIRIGHSLGQEWPRQEWIMRHTWHGQSYLTRPLEGASKLEGHLAGIQKAMDELPDNDSIQTLGLKVLDALCPQGWTRTGLSLSGRDWQHIETGVGVIT